MFLQRDFVECYLVQIVYHVDSIDLNFSPGKLCLFSCRMSEKTIFISIDVKQKCVFPG
jgi:hypothetical protein